MLVSPRNSCGWLRGGWARGGSWACPSLRAGRGHLVSCLVGFLGPCQLPLGWSFLTLGAFYVL